MGKAVQDLVRKKNSGFMLKATAPPLQAFNKWEEEIINGVIDFSSPVLFGGALKWCLSNKKPFVSGTTALSSVQKRQMKSASKKIPIFYEENMSWGIWQIKNWIKSVSGPIDNILLEDIHHKNKKDKPSGTALKLQKNFPVSMGKRLKIKSVRKGKEFGTHRILFKSPEEVVLLEHKALSRHLFAGGALQALKWLVKKPPGFYSFEHIYSQ